MGFKEREQKRSQSVVKSIVSYESQLNEQDDTQDIVKKKDKVESKSKRLNLLIKPSTYTKAKKKCDKLGISFNECINQLIENWLDN